VSTIRQTIDHPVFETSGVAAESGRGRTAERPTDIPARGWLDVSWRAAKRFSDDNVTLIAGGLAMYALLSVFPALAATVSIYGMFATPSDVIDQMTAFAGVLPPGVWDIFSTELQSITRTGQTTLTFAAALGIVVALWSARAAMSSLMTATNIAYRERETRGFVRTTLLSLAFTAGAVLGFLLMLTLGVVIPLALAAFGTADWTKAAVGILRMARICDRLPLRARARARPVALGIPGLHRCRHIVVGSQCPIRLLCDELRRLRQNVWRLGRRGRTADVVFHFEHRCRAGSSNQRGAGAADGQGHN
jgi:hypothetical protein